MHERLLLDTCGLLWLASGNKELSESCYKAIEDASAVYVSPISAWEIGQKFKQGKLILPLPPEEWFHAIQKHHQLLSAELSTEILFASVQLPDHHKDLADRFIIATAKKLRAAIVTKDEKFNAYDVTVLA